MRSNLAVLLAFLFITATAFAESSRPLPRFASLRANEVNLRVGPGTNYEISWVYRRKALPVEIIAEFDTWRKIRDAEGTTGWVQQTMLSPKRTALITAQRRILRENPEDTASPAAYIDPGIIVSINQCKGEWCQLKAPGRITGWLKRGEMWGLYPNEFAP